MAGRNFNFRRNRRGSLGKRRPSSMIGTDPKNRISPQSPIYSPSGPVGEVGWSGMNPGGGGSVACPDGINFTNNIQDCPGYVHAPSWSSCGNSQDCGCVSAQWEGGGTSNPCHPYDQMCSCDDFCTHWGDCCADYSFWCPNPPYN